MVFKNILKHFLLFIFILIQVGCSNYDQKVESSTPTTLPSATPQLGEKVENDALDKLLENLANSTINPYLMRVRIYLNDNYCENYEIRKSQGLYSEEEFYNIGKEQQNAQADYHSLLQNLNMQILNDLSKLTLYEKKDELLMNEDAILVLDNMNGFYEKDSIRIYPSNFIVINVNGIKSTYYCDDFTSHVNDYTETIESMNLKAIINRYSVGYSQNCIHSQSGKDLGEMYIDHISYESLDLNEKFEYGVDITTNIVECENDRYTS